MKLLSTGATVLLLSGVAAASQTDYSSFDRDIEALASGRLADDSGPHISGYVQVRYSNSSDKTVGVDLDNDDVDDVANDLGGFSVPRARVSFKGERAGYGYKVQVDFNSSSILKDAYVDVPVGEYSVRAGLFQSALSRNGRNSSSKLFFINRSEIGDLFDNRDAGAMVHGSFDRLSLFLSLMNGLDQEGDELMTVVRAEYDFLGDGIGKYEGAYGGPGELTGTFGVAIYDDGTIDDGSATLIEAHVASAQFSAGIEVLNADARGIEAAPGSSMAVDDATTMSLYGTYMLTPDQWEVGARFQSLDDDDDTTVMDLAVNRYIDGHKLKYTIGYRSIGSDDDAVDADLIQIQLQVAF